MRRAHGRVSATTKATPTTIIARVMVFPMRKRGASIPSPPADVVEPTDEPLSHRTLKARYGRTATIAVMMAARCSDVTGAGADVRAFATATPELEDVL